MRSFYVVQGVSEASGIIYSLGHGPQQYVDGLHSGLVHTRHQPYYTPSIVPSYPTVLFRGPAMKSTACRSRA